MPFRPRIARVFSALAGGPEVRDRAERLAFPDAGHGYDRFGMHPDFVAEHTFPSGTVWRGREASGDIGFLA